MIRREVIIGGKPKRIVPYYCGECDRYERDPIFLDVERCSECGELIEASDDD